MSASAFRTFRKITKGSRSFGACLLKVFNHNLNILKVLVMKTMRIMRSKHTLSLGLEPLRKRNNITHPVTTKTNTKNTPAKVTLMVVKY